MRLTRRRMKVPRPKVAQATTRGFLLQSVCDQVSEGSNQSRGNGQR